MIANANGLPQPVRLRRSDLGPRRQACTDFYGYVNDKWIATHAIPGDRSSWGAYQILEERTAATLQQVAETAAAGVTNGVDKIVGDFWASGMDTARIEAAGLAPLQTRLTAIDALNDKDAIADYLRRSAVRGEYLLFGFQVIPDANNPRTNMAYAMQGGLGLPDASFYADDAAKDVYRAHVAKVLELSGVPAADAAVQAQNVVAFETRLAGVSLSMEELESGYAALYNPLAPAAADAVTPNFRWTDFFLAQGIALPQTFSLAVPAFHQEVNKALADTDPAVWRAYLRLRTVDLASPYLSDAFANEHHAFYGALLAGQTQIPPRGKRVLDTINGNAGEALGQLYIKAAFPAEAKTKAQTLMNNLLAAFKGRLERLTWMSAQTKDKALAKWRTVTVKIGYPDHWRDWSGLDTRPDDYFGNIQAAIAFNHRQQLAKIGNPVDKTEWSDLPQTVDASYDALRHDITLSAAVLQPPFFDAKADDPLNYGGIGAVIGHEITHGYDAQGSRFDAEGRLNDWWTPADAQTFAGLTDKLVQQYGAYEVNGQPVNGKLTLNENIADLGGVTTAYDAMKQATRGRPDRRIGGFTREQRFFLNFAVIWRSELTPQAQSLALTTDMHAPARFRGNGPTSNLPTFAAALRCKPGDAMVRDPAQRITIW
jgi:putative endopeptidase